MYTTNINFDNLTLFFFFLVTFIQDMLSQQDQLELAASYIKQLRERVEGLRRVKEEQAITTTRTSSSAMSSMMIGLRLPVVELRDFGSTIEVVLISGLNKNFMFYEVINVLSEEGAEVVSASYSTVGDKVFHTIHAQVIIDRCNLFNFNPNLLLVNISCTSISCFIYIQT